VSAVDAAAAMGGRAGEAPVPLFAGAVLCGGASRRMGRDKALIPVGGRPLAVRIAAAIAVAGATRVLAVGGDLAGLRAAGLDAVPDASPGAGPLAGIVTALTELAGPADGTPTATAGRPPVGVVFVAACDLLAPDPAAVRATVAALAADTAHAVGADVAVPVVGDRHQWLHAAWRAETRAPLAAAFTAGERSVRGAVAAAGLRVHGLALPAAAVADADTPADLPSSGPE
jgi:molybdenum cofactor guanylyltransferase